MANGFSGTFETISDILEFYSQVTGDDGYTTLTDYLTTQHAGSEFEVSFTYEDLNADRSGDLRNFQICISTVSRI
jgi:hypothetical protein